MSAAESPVEKHYSADELAKLWQLHPSTVRDLFRDEPGVLLIGNQKSTRFKRSYTTLRIPLSVVERVHRRMSKV